MATAHSLISDALGNISSTTPGEAIPGGEVGEALDVLNKMYASWSAQNLMPPCQTLESFTLSTLKADYTLGQSGPVDFNTVRPDEITNAFRRDSQGNDYPVNPMTREQWESIPLKSNSSLPEWFYYDTQYPNGVIRLNCVPSQTDTLFIDGIKPVNQFATLQSVMQLPGEYEEVTEYLLSKRLAVKYGYPISNELASLIQDADKWIKSKNVRPKAANFDLAFLRPRPVNINTGF